MMSRVSRRGECRGSGRYRGYTLVEVLIVVAIVAILGAIAYPAYTNNVLKSRRAEARSVLQDYAAKQERYFSRNNTYASSLGALNVSAASENGHYTIALGTLASPLDSYNESFVLTATATGRQAEDQAACHVFTIDSQGSRTGCW